VDSTEKLRSIVECRVRTVSSNGKVVVKPKLIARRSPEEAEFLDDLMAWIIHSGASGTDEVFSFGKRDGKVVRRNQEDVRHQRTPPRLLQRAFAEKGSDNAHARARSDGGRP
jgi:hypothetical protein